MSYIQSLILGLVEGLTEFLPISSTAHMTLASQLLHLSQQDEFLKSFEIIIQLGAILAVAAIYWRKLLVNLKLLSKVLVAFIPTGVIGLTIYKILKEYLLNNDYILLGSIVLGGLAIIILEKTLKHHVEDNIDHELAKLTYKQAFCIGCYQSIAIIPGVSRSAATIFGGMALGLSRSAIVEFSFLLAIPTMAAATGLDLIKSGHNFTHNQLGLLAVGLISAFVVAMLSVKYFLNFIKKHNFSGFGYYRLILGAILAIFLFWR